MRIMKMWSRLIDISKNLKKKIFSPMTQVWQKGEGSGCEVYVKFKNPVSVQRFLTLNYVRYRSRAITVSAVKEQEGLAEYLAC